MKLGKQKETKEEHSNWQHANAPNDLYKPFTFSKIGSSSKLH